MENLSSWERIMDDQLRYHTVIDVRSTRGKNSRGHKITSLAVHGDKLLITSNDSRVRIYDLRDMDLTCKFKGAQIEHSQIRASFSPDGRHIISGSEDGYIYIWRTSDLPSTISVRKDRNHMWERVRAHASVVTAAVFAPKPQLYLSLFQEAQSRILTTPKNSATSFTLNSNYLMGRVDNATSSAAKIRNSLDRSLIFGSAQKNNLGSLTPVFNSGAMVSMTPVGTLPSGNNSGVINGNKDTEVCTGDVIVSADLNGSLKIFINPIQARFRTGAVTNYF